MSSSAAYFGTTTNPSNNSPTHQAQTHTLAPDNHHHYHHHHHQNHFQSPHQFFHYITSGYPSTPSSSGESSPSPIATSTHATTSMSSALNTPFPTSNIRTAHPPATTTTTATTTASSASHQPFTSSMRDRQARGKDPYEDSASEMDLDMAEMDLDFEPDLDLFDPSSDDFVGGLVRTPRHLHPNQSSDDSYLRRKVGRGVAAAAAAATASSSSPAAAAANLRRGRPPGESWESWRRREWARDVLETPELLMWYASSRDDSIPGTRLYFTRLLCGYEDDHSATQHHHDPPTTPRKNSSGSGRPSAHRRR